MDDTDLELEQESIETAPAESPDIVGTTGRFKKNPKNPDVEGYASRSQAELEIQAASEASVMDRFRPNEALLKNIDARSTDVTTFETVRKLFDSGPREDASGRFVLPEVPDVEAMLAKNTPENQLLYRENYNRNVAKLELMSENYSPYSTMEKFEKYTWGLRDEFLKIATNPRRLNQWASYYAGEAVAGVGNIATGALSWVGIQMGANLQGSGIVISKVGQNIGVLGSDAGQLHIDLGVLIQDFVVQKDQEFKMFVEETLSKVSPTGKRNWFGEYAVANAAPVLSSVGAAAKLGGIAGRLAVRGAAKGATKAAAKEIAQNAATSAARKVSVATRFGFAATEASDYYQRPAEGKTSEEYQEYLRNRSLGELTEDVFASKVVGAATYFLDSIGGEGTIAKYFGPYTRRLIKNAGGEFLKEGLTEVAQDPLGNIADAFRGRMSWNEVMDQFVSWDTLQTFLFAGTMGTFFEIGHYETARADLVKEFKANVEKAFPETTPEQRDKMAKNFIESMEKDVIAKTQKAIIADDQLRRQYGTYWQIVNTRINELINQSVAQGKELNLKDKSPEYQAQFVGSVAQRFVDELYAQSVLRGVPVSEVFDVTKIDVENGIMYMYGEEYGRRPIAQVNADVTPQQWEEAQREKRIADELQRQQKEQEKQAKEAVKQARALEREQARQQAQETRQENVRNRNVARAEIREMEENQARGMVAALHPDLPVQIMTKSELKQILRSELDNYFALQNKDQIKPIERQKPARVRQQSIMAQPKMAQFDIVPYKERARKLDVAKDLDVLQRKSVKGEKEQNEELQAQQDKLVSERAELIREFLSKNGLEPGNYKDVGKHQGSRYFGFKGGLSASDGKIIEVRVSNHRKGKNGGNGHIIDLRIDQGTEQALQTLNDELMRLGVLSTKSEEQTFSQQIKEQSDLAAENARLDAENPPYEGETITVDGKERTVYNSNGDRIAKSKPALENFWRWFGDSKVVDEQGRPLVVYHGTNIEFEEFAEKPATDFGKGFYFTTSQLKAQEYALRASRTKGKKTIVGGYLKIDNPFISNNTTSSGFLYEVGDKFKKDHRPASNKAVQGLLRENGFDGIKISMDNQGFGFDYYVAFESNQIKSTENRGTFSSDTGNIFYQKRLAAWNPLRRSIELFDGANETSILHELSHFWLDNMMLYSRSPLAQQNPAFMAVWNNIKKYLNIDDRQERISAAQAEKYTSAYMQYIRDNKTAPIQDLGFKGMDEYIGDMAEDYFENALHKDEEGDVYSEVEELTPEIVDALQKLTTTDLSDAKNVAMLLNQDKQLVQQLQETERMVEKGDITQEQKNELDAANISAYAVNKSIENMDAQDKQTVAASETMQALDTEQKTVENDIKKFDAEGGNTNSLQRRLNMTELAKDIAANDEALGKHDTHRDMLKVAEAADNFVNSRLEDAKLIVDGKMAEQEGLFASDLYTALERKAIQGNDADLFDFLRHSAMANQLAKELGQRVAGFRNYKGNGEVDIMSALKALDKKYEKAYDSKAKEQVQVELNALAESIAKQDTLADEKLGEVLDSMECK